MILKISFVSNNFKEAFLRFLPAGLGSNTLLKYFSDNIRKKIVKGKKISNQQGFKYLFCLC